LKSQIVQDRIDRIRVKIVPAAEFGEKDRDHLIHELRLRLGPTVSIEVDLVPDIPREESGKFRWVVSHVSHDGKLSWS
jgi:phenylacetate-CoA ligase